MRPDLDLARRSHALLTRAMGVEASARRGFVREACPDDPALMSRVLSFLDAADRSEAFLETPACVGRRDPAAEIPDAVGSYLVVGVLGVGGMATVYEAIQEHPKRRVALKVLHHGMMHSDAYARFRFETEALARLHHPGIAQIYEAGAARLGQPAPSPFFAMELIPDAAPITAYADRHNLDLRQRVRMLASVCDAVHHGHQHGVIHRDLKPANVLVDGEGRPKVIDFGVARATEVNPDSPSSVADRAQLVGTVQYMSPEQCGAGHDIDTRTDVYSLGVVLYEMACRRLPHTLSCLPLPAALNAIIHDPPDRVGPPYGQADRDFEAVVLKAIEKNPERRYASAAALASDLRRWLRRQPVEARPPGVFDLCRLYAERNRALVAGGVVVLLSLLTLAAVSTVFAVRLSHEAERRRVAEVRTASERDLARRQAYTARIAGALSAMNTGEFQQMRTHLTAAAGQTPGWEWGFLTRLSERSASVVEAHDAMIFDLAVNHDWSRYATAAADGTVRLWDAADRSLIASFRNGSGAAVHAVAFLPDGRALVTGDSDGVVRLLEATGLDDLGVLGTLPARVRSVAALPDGRIAAADYAGTARLWNPATGVGQPFAADQPGGTHGVKLSDDGRILATYNNEGSVWLRGTADLAVQRRFEFPGAVNQVRFSRDGRLLAAVGTSGRVLVWSVEDGTIRRQLEASKGVQTIRSVAFSHAGDMLAVGLTHRDIVVFSLADGAVLGKLNGHAEAVSSLHFQPDDRFLVSASWDRTIRTWRASEFASGSGKITLTGHSGHVRGLAFSPDGSSIASASRDGSLRLWDPDTAQPIARITPGGGAVYSADFSPDGRLIAAACDDGAIRLLDSATGLISAELRGHEEWASSVAFDPVGKRVVSGGQDGTLRVWDRATGQPRLVLDGHTARVNSAKFSPDGSVIASGSRDRSVRLWDAGTGEQLFHLTDHHSDVFSVLFSRDGRRLFTGSRDQTVRVWDVATGSLLGTLEGHGQAVTCLALSPDESRLAAGSWYGEIVLFDTGTLELIASFRAHDAAIRDIAFSPDGRWLASASYDSTVRLFDSATREHADAAREAALSAHAAATDPARTALNGAGGDAVAALELLAAGGLDPRQNPWIRKALLAEIAPAMGPP